MVATELQILSFKQFRNKIPKFGFPWEVFEEIMRGTMSVIVRDNTT